MDKKSTFQPIPKFLLSWSTLKKGDALQVLQIPMNMLTQQGFTAAKKVTPPCEFMQLLGPENNESAIAYWSLDKDACFLNSGLAWSIAEEVEVGYIRSAIRSTIDQLAVALNQPTAALWRLDEWREQHCPSNAAVFSAFWKRPSDLPSVEKKAFIHKDVMTFQKSLRDEKNVMSLVVSVSKTQENHWTATTLLRI